jgi:hypothetical protein
MKTYREILESSKQKFNPETHSKIGKGKSGSPWVDEQKALNSLHREGKKMRDKSFVYQDNEGWWIAMGKG